ncbi:MAG: NAD(P)-dependent oxidoreductase, partial [Puniceicoccaceae bacterium]
RAKADSLLGAGAIWCDHPAAVAQEAQVIFTMLGYPSDVRTVYQGREGLVESAKPGTVLIDLTTSDPQLAQQIAAKGAARGVHVLDAPVTGGDKGAQAGTLSIMIGGDPIVAKSVDPILAHFSSKRVRQGGAGAGQHTKMCNQIALAGIMMSLCEAYQYSCHAGLNPSTVLESIGEGAASSWPMKHLLPAIIEGNDAPGFYVKHFLKDLEIALDAAKTLCLDLPTLKQARKLYNRLVNIGYGDLGTQALMHWYREHNE